jgi:hypothetical protein
MHFQSKSLNSRKLFKTEFLGTAVPLSFRHRGHSVKLPFRIPLTDNTSELGDKDTDDVILFYTLSY